MKTVNHEYYVSLEVAKLLKKAGFDWETKNRWDYCKPIDEWSLRNYPEEPRNWNSKYYNYDCSAPTLAVAQKWLREVKNISIDISSNSYSEYKYIIRKVNQSQYSDNTILALTACGFYTYEEAQEFGIKKALEIILEIGE